MFRTLISLFICLVITANGAVPQPKAVLNVTGSVKVDRGLVEGATIQIFRNEGFLNNVTINRTGNFRVPLDIGQVYRFRFSKEGYYSKSIEIDTRIPPEVCQKDCFFPPYQIAVNLYATVPGVAIDESDIPRISYNPVIDNFDAEILRQAASVSNRVEKIMNDIKQQSTRYERESEQLKQKSYNDAISEADQFKNRKEYQKAMHRYRDALMIFPHQRHPREQVGVMYQLLISEQLFEALGPAEESNLLKYINYGDRSFRENEFTVAKVAYETALRIRPGEQQLIEKLSNAQRELDNLFKLGTDEANHFQNVYQARTSRYNELVKQGDELFKQEKLAEAKDRYAQAATQINERSYAVLMVNKIDELMNDDELARRMAKEREEADKSRLLEARNKAYADAIQEADQLFEQRLYRDAVEYYELALTIKDFEIYPRNQIRIIRDILARMQLIGEDYNRLISEADALFRLKSYPEARDIYRIAHEMVPNEKYAMHKIQEIDRLMLMADKERVIQEKYDSLIKKADEKYNIKLYDDAVNLYQEAIGIKPSESYPQDQIRKIREILSRESDAQKRLAQQQNDYDRTITLADNAFNQESFSSARSLYQDALRIFPGQDYPINQIKRIDQLLEDRRNEQKKSTTLESIDFSNLQNITFEQREAAYKDAMALGDSFMKTEEWGIARFYFRRALVLIPNDRAATTKVDEVEARIRGNTANETKFTEMMQRADEAFATGDFSVARFYYIKAKEIKPDDDHVNERIRVATQLVESTSARVANREYDDSMNRANEALTAKNYSVARFFYRKALSHKPNDTIAKQKLDEVEKLIRQ